MKIMNFSAEFRNGPRHWGPLKDLWCLCWWLI